MNQSAQNCLIGVLVIAIGAMISLSLPPTADAISHLRYTFGVGLGAAGVVVIIESLWGDYKC